MKDSRKTSTVILRRLVQSGCFALVATPALASNPWIESHVSATYGYVLGKSEVAGRSLAAASPAKADDPKTRTPKKASSPATPNTRPASGN